MRALQIALGIACLAVVYSGFAPVIGATAVTPTRVPPIEPPPAIDASPDRYQVIAARNLFRTREAAPLEPTDEDLKESELRLKLCGTYAALPTENSVACIDDQGTQKRRAYRVGQEISPGVNLVAVERRRAVIDNRGAREQLTMEETPTVGAIVTPQAARVTPARPASSRGQGRLSERLRELRDRTPDDQASTDALRPKLQAALEGAQISPVYSEAGEFGGVKLTSIRPGGPFAGLAENTVCFELNGAKLDGVQTLPQALMSSSNGQACLRCRQPDGVETLRCL
jgi:hypothetical protein